MGPRQAYQIHIIGIPEGEDRERSSKKFEEIIAVKFSNLIKNMNVYI